MTDEYINDIMNEQPVITISTFGKVANGKSSLIKALTGINPMKFKKEAEKNMTIKLGYTNAKFYKCLKCPEPYCYQNTKKCSICDNESKLILNISFIDAPGHTNLLSTALSGVSSIDYCLLLASVENMNDQDTNEHYKTIKTMNLLHKTILIQNKLDLVPKHKAIEHYNILKNQYDIENIIPVCAQFNFGINNLIGFMHKFINIDKEEFKLKTAQPLKLSIIRSFDVNKPNTNVQDLKGGVVGGVIKQGVLTIGDKVKIMPGLITSKGLTPLEATVISLKTEQTDLQNAYSGGLIGVGLNIDPSLTKEDRLVGNYIVKEDTNLTIFENCKIKYIPYQDMTNINELYRNNSINSFDDSLFNTDPITRIDSINSISSITSTCSNESYVKIFKKNTLWNIFIGSTKRQVKIIKINKTNHVYISSTIKIAGEIGDKIIFIRDNNTIAAYGLIETIY